MADAGVAPACDAGREDEVALLEISVGMSTIPAMPLSGLLGNTRDSIEILLSPIRPETREERKAVREQEKLGWVQYTRHLKVRFTENDLAVEIVQQVPEDLSCEKAAHWMGFPNAMPAKRNEGSCEWPAGSDKHLLGKGLRGSLVFDGASFSAALDPIPEPATEDKQ